ncbi:MAG: lysophospholipid acyltransferase family protein [Lautropia sp.]|nr:lysophospholipid acyltransferase family protein [Lautropia sp.]
MQLLRSVLFMLVMAITVIFCASLTVLCFFLPVQIRYKIAATFPGLMLHAGRWICGMRWQVIGTENLPDHPVIVLSKHQSTWETFFLVSQMPRHAAFVFKREILFIPFFGWAIGMLDMMHIDRRQGRRAFASIVKAAPKQLDDYGRWIVMFPEGTRIPPGQTGEYKSGGARLALQNKTPILPVAVNAGHCWPKKPFIKQPGLITVSYGPLISVEGKTSDQINREVETWIETEMRRIDAERYGDADKVYVPREKHREASGRDATTA